jgi:cysteine desulfurase
MTIYLDHAATTPVAPEALEAMLPFFRERFANPAAIYTPGLEANDAVETARETIAASIGAAPDRIVFTSGGTESNNFALRGAALAAEERGRHILTTPIEHRAVLEPLEDLAGRGFEIEMLPVGGDGLVDPDAAASRIRPDTTLVSVMHANNEIGAIEPIAAIGGICRERGVLFHTDAVQSYGKIPIDVRAMQVDLLSMSAHKIYGPKGVGALYVRRAVGLRRFMAGGEQEGGRRAGTLNVPGIVGFGAAAALAAELQESEMARLADLRDRFMEQLEHSLPRVLICGSREHRLANNIHVCIAGVDAGPLLLALDERGICASAGSACSAGSTEPSHVLLAIGVPRERARGALRLTLGRDTMPEDTQCALRAICDSVTALRALG